MFAQLQVDDIIEGKIDTIAFGGDGILRHQGIVIFVPFTAPGDIISCRITEIRKSFAKGSLVQIIKAGPQRIKPGCPYFGTCGGCQIQHLNEEGQLKYKLEAVQDALQRIGHLKINTLSIVPADQKWAYRRHVTLHLKPHLKSFEAGYIGVDNKSLVVIQHCPIFNREEDPVIQELQFIIKQIPNSKEQEGRVTILKTKQDQYILFFHFDETFEVDKSLFKHMLQHYPIFTGIIVRIGNQQEYFGDPYTEIVLEGLKFRITPQTFIQNHPGQSANIYKHVCNLMGEGKKRKILDLYCGFGIMTQLLSKQGHSVIGVEYNREAIKFARESTLQNKLHARFVEGDVDRLLPKLAKEMQPDAILVNPPRTGLAKEVLQTLLRIQAQEIIYVSCMPATLARDLATLCSEKYALQECVAYDMFPQTAHVETLTYSRLKT